MGPLIFTAKGYQGLGIKCIKHNSWDAGLAKESNVMWTKKNIQSQHPFLIVVTEAEKLRKRQRNMLCVRINIFFFLWINSLELYLLDSTNLK